MTGILVWLEIHEKLALSDLGKNHIKDPKGKHVNGCTLIANLFCGFCETEPIVLESPTESWYQAWEPPLI